VARCGLDLPSLGQAVSRQRFAATAALRSVGPVVAVVAVVAAIAGCSLGPSVPVGAQPSATPSIHLLAPPSVAAAPDGVEAARTVAQFVKKSNGVTLPDRRATPGAAYPDVTATDICDLHYVLGVRQPRFNDKVAAFANYGVSIHDREFYQVDHLIPISLGGSNAIQNLWPQPYAGSPNADTKDLLERQLRGLVCSHKLSLLAAQKAIVSNWWSAYNRYMGLAIDPGSAGLDPWTPPSQVVGEVANGAPCAKEGKIGYTDNKHVRLTCTATSDGQLRWTKRY
jgi:hypothetical protein